MGSEPYNKSCGTLCPTGFIPVAFMARLILTVPCFIIYVEGQSKLPDHFLGKIHFNELFQLFCLIVYYRRNRFVSRYF